MSVTARAIERHQSRKSLVLDALIAGAQTAPEVAKASGLSVREASKYLFTMSIRGFVKIAGSAPAEICECCGKRRSGRPRNVYELAVGK